MEKDPVGRRRGVFTLTELLAVILIIGVEVALLLPAAGRAWAAARPLEGRSETHQPVAESQLFGQRDSQGPLAYGH